MNEQADPTMRSVRPESATNIKLGRGLVELVALMGAVLALFAIAMPIMNLPWRFYWRIVLGGAPNELIWLFLVLVLAWSAAFLVGRSVYNLSFRACFGLSVLTYLFSRLFFLSVVDLQVVANPNSVADAIPRISLYRTVTLKFIREVFLPLGALLLLFGAIPRMQAAVHELPSRLQSTLGAVRSWVKKDPLTDTMHGFWLFFVILMAAIGLEWLLTQGLPGAQTGNEDAVFSQMTLDLVLLLSLAAGIGEEFMFRGILLSYLLFAFGVKAFTTQRDQVLAGVAVTIQALFFGLIHSGYGNLAHILGPMALGIVLGVVALRFGLLPAIIVHVLIDVAAFSQEVTTQFPWITAAVSVITLTGLFASGVYFLFQYFTWKEQQRKPPQFMRARDVELPPGYA